MRSKICSKKIIFIFKLKTRFRIKISIGKTLLRTKRFCNFNSKKLILKCTVDEEFNFVKSH